MNSGKFMLIDGEVIKLLQPLYTKACGKALALLQSAVRFLSYIDFNIDIQNHFWCQSQVKNWGTNLCRVKMSHYTIKQIIVN